jgi:hypothetical protein
MTDIGMPGPFALFYLCFTTNEKRLSIQGSFCPSKTFSTNRMRLFFPISKTVDDLVP